MAFLLLFDDNFMEGAKCDVGMNRELMPMMWVHADKSQMLTIAFRRDLNGGENPPDITEILCLSISELINLRDDISEFLDEHPELTHEHIPHIAVLEDIHVDDEFGLRRDRPD